MGLQSEEGTALARMAYEAYCEATGWRSAITGQELPPFDKTPDAVQAGWMAAAYAVRYAIESQTFYR